MKPKTTPLRPPDKYGRYPDDRTVDVSPKTNGRIHDLKAASGYAYDRRTIVAFAVEEFHRKYLDDPMDRRHPLEPFTLKSRTP